MLKRAFIFCVLIISILLFIGISQKDSFKYSENISDDNNKLSSETKFVILPCNGPDTINVTIQDSLNIVNAKLFYAKNFNPWDSSLMVKTGPNTWRGIMYLSGIATYRYYIKTFDSLNRIGTMPAGAPANYYSFICNGTDTTKPVITHTPIGNTPKAIWPVSISAAVSDASGIDSAWVRWRKNSGITKQFKLFYYSGNTYSSPFISTMSEVNPGDTIRYRIIAQDASSQHNKDSTALYSFLIISGVGINPGNGIILRNYYLSQNYPNPFNPVTRISYEIPKQGFVSLKIYDVLGREAKNLVNEMKSIGSYSVDFDASGFTSGIYLYRLECNGYIETKRMVLLK